ncbi:hypothetical protein DFP72DRAFT_814903 [Ephemerocybe angulata]|uniref:F-box domain-containing protein n=1 Tax=Ephemerocybe angulata TaxID=980116 RepID=A0A8H6HUC3_9AGAR|nr:hypothetical protein DFP72DRAFT_814903 [Tulosesus angulatus]
MPPRSSKRVKRLAAPSNSAPLPATPYSNSILTRLPSELVFEVISFFDHVPIDRPNDDFSNHLRPDGRSPSPKTGSRFDHRQDSLRAMSQTCKAWREFFWPILWENVELGAARGTGSGPWYKRVSKVLIDKCEGLANTPLVAAQVRGIRISLSKPNIKDDLESLIKGLRACPNLKVLNFYFVQNTSITPLKNAFKGNSFPSIERVILPSSAHNALRSCPNVKAVICSGGKGGGMQILSSIQAACKKVEVLGGVVPDNDKEKAEFVNKAIPNLRDIRFLNNGANTKVSSISSSDQVLRRSDSIVLFSMTGISGFIEELQESPDHRTHWYWT